MLLISYCIFTTFFPLHPNIKISLHNDNNRLAHFVGWIDIKNYTNPSWVCNMAHLGGQLGRCGSQRAGNEDKFEEETARHLEDEGPYFGPCLFLFGVSHAFFSEHFPMVPSLSLYFHLYPAVSLFFEKGPPYKKEVAG